VNAAAGVAAITTAAVVLFSAGLAAIDHFAGPSNSGAIKGTFSATSQGDYQPDTASRIAPQRSR
jgi:hypothetical protein